MIETLERRTMLSTTIVNVDVPTTLGYPVSSQQASPANTDLPTLAGLNTTQMPAQIVQSVGAGNISFDGVTGDGSGQTNFRRGLPLQNRARSRFAPRREWLGLVVQCGLNVWNQTLTVVTAGGCR